MSIVNEIEMQKPEVVQQPEEIPKLRKVVKKVEEPKKEEPKRTKVKIPKAKKYEDLPEIPDYERPELEVYEESEFDPTKMEKAVPTPLQEMEKPAESAQQPAQQPTKNGLPKVWFVLYFLFAQHFAPFIFLLKLNYYYEMHQCLHIYCT